MFLNFFDNFIKHHSYFLNRKHEMFLNCTTAALIYRPNGLNRKHEMFLNTYLENPHISEEFIN